MFAMRNNFRAAWRWCLVCLPVCALVLGCDSGPKRVPVSGQVLLDGKPLTSGYIWFMPKNERAASSAIDSEGRFTLSTYDEHDGCVLGMHTVTVTATKPINDMQTLHLIPPKYNDPATSGLAFEIDGPRSDLQVNLSWDGGKPFVEGGATLGDVAPIAE
jgi:hypothetical protein